MKLLFFNGFSIFEFETVGLPPDPEGQSGGPGETGQWLQVGAPLVGGLRGRPRLGPVRAEEARPRPPPESVSALASVTHRCPATGNCLGILFFIYVCLSVANCTLSFEASSPQPKPRNYDEEETTLSCKKETFKQLQLQ